MTDSERYARGLEMAADITGQTGIDIIHSLGDLGKMIVEQTYAEVYTRPGLPMHDRMISTLTALIVLNREPQLRVHMESALRHGITSDEIREVILHTVAYAGFPTAINAWRVLQSITGETR